MPSPPSWRASRSACRRRRTAPRRRSMPSPTPTAMTACCSPSRCTSWTTASARSCYLRFHADMTERQIAREVGISQAHVSRLLAGALTKLRAELAESETPVTTADTTPEPVVSPAVMASEQARERHRQGRRERQGGRQVRPRDTADVSWCGCRATCISSSPRPPSASRSASTALSPTPSPSPSPSEAPPGRRRQPHPPPIRSPGPKAAAADPNAARNPRRTLRMVLAANLVVVVLAGIVAVVLLVLALNQGL